MCQIKKMCVGNVYNKNKTVIKYRKLGLNGGIKLFFEFFHQK